MVYDVARVEAVGFEDDGVFGEGEGAVVSGVVAMVADDDVFDDFLEAGLVASFSHFDPASSGALFDAGGEEYFEVGFGGDDGGDVAALEDTASLGDDGLLEVDHAPSDGGEGAELAGGLADFEGADVGGDVFAVEEGLAVGAEFDVGLSGEGGDEVEVLGAEAGPGRFDGKGAVHRAGVEEGEAGGLGEEPGDGRLAGSSGSVDRDDERGVVGRGRHGISRGLVGVLFERLARSGPRNRGRRN